MGTPSSIDRQVLRKLYAKFDTFVTSVTIRPIFCTKRPDYKSLVSVGELNFSQYFLNERYRVASFKVSFALFKVFSNWVSSGKPFLRLIPMISLWLPSAILHDLQFPHHFPFELKTMWRIFLSSRAENPIYPPVFLDIFPWLSRGSTPEASRWHHWHVHNYQHNSPVRWAPASVYRSI